MKRFTVNVRDGGRTQSTLHAHGQVPARQGPRGPGKLSPDLAGRVRELDGQGMALAEIAAQFGASAFTVRAALGRVRPRGAGPAAAGGPGAEPEAAQEAGQDHRNETPVQERRGQVPRSGWALAGSLSARRTFSQLQLPELEIAERPGQRFHHIAVQLDSPCRPSLQAIGQPVLDRTAHRVPGDRVRTQIVLGSEVRQLGDHLSPSWRGRRP